MSLRHVASECYTLDGFSLDFGVICADFVPINLFDSTLFPFRMSLRGHCIEIVFIHFVSMKLFSIRLETKSCRILPLTYVTKYDMT